MKLKISRLTTKTIDTTRGEAVVFNFQSGGQWYSSFVAAWNKNWQNGTELDVAAEQIKSRTKNGKTYLTVVAPSRTSPSANAGPSTGNTGDSQKRIIDALKLIYRDLQEIKKTLGIKAEAHHG